jgi:hypothetical protein
VPLCKNTYFTPYPLFIPFFFVAILKIIVLYIFDISEFRVVVSVAVSAQERCSVRLYLQLFVGSSCLIYVICICLRLVVSTIYCVVFLFCFSLSCVPMLPVFLGRQFLFALSVFSNVYLLK